MFAQWLCYKTFLSFSIRCWWLFGRRFWCRLGRLGGLRCSLCLFLLAGFDLAVLLAIRATTFLRWRFPTSRYQSLYTCFSGLPKWTRANRCVLYVGFQFKLRIISFTIPGCTFSSFGCCQQCFSIRGHNGNISFASRVSRRWCLNEIVLNLPKTMLRFFLGGSTGSSQSK